jgi:tRNA (guanine-N7-)-methyltransferase
MRNPLNVAVISAEECDAILDRFDDTTLPFVVDLGSALGDFLLGLESRWRGGPGVDLLRDVASPGVTATHTAPSTTAEDPEDSNSRQSGGSPALAREGSVASASSAAPSNYLGLELRGWCVDHAIKHVPAEAAGRLWFAALSVHNSLKVLIDRLHERGERGAVPVLRGVTIQFPDPWAKAKTVRRRILQPDLAELIVRNLEVTHGFLYASTDCAVMARDMELVMEPHCAAGVMRRAVVYGDVGVDGGDLQASSWLPSNPFGVPSEREARVCSVFGRAPFRALYWKVAECA